MSYLCWSHSAVSCHWVQITISNQIGDCANYDLACNYWNVVQFSDWWLSWREMSIIIGVLHGAVSKVSRHVCETNSLTSTSWEGQVPPSVQDRDGADYANWMLCLFPLGPKALNTSWISLKTSRLMPHTNSRSSSTPPHIGTQAPDWYHLNWFHLIFVDKSRVSP